MRYSDCKTVDQLTVALLLDNNQEGIQKLNQKLKESLDGSMECPDCGDTNPKDDNGASGEDRMFSCNACGNCFDAPTTIDFDDLDLEE